MRRQIDFLVEEASMEEFLRGILPQLLGPTNFQIYTSQGKRDLLKNLPARLRAYAKWIPSDHAIVVLLDRDDNDCYELKTTLEDIASSAGLATRSSSSDGRYTVVNRVAIEELEAWYFGDWEAVRCAYPKVKATIPQQAAYRDPDAIAGGTWEAFHRVLRQGRYFMTGLRKVEAARRIATHIDPERNTSRSFQVFRDAILDLVQSA